MSVQAITRIKIIFFVQSFYNHRYKAYKTYNKVNKNEHLFFYQPWSEAKGIALLLNISKSSAKTKLLKKLN